MTETAIILSCKKQEEIGQKAMVHQYSPLLMAIAFRYSLSEHISKDIIQDTFIQVFRKIDLYDLRKGDFKPWLKAICIRIILMHFRKEKSLFNHLKDYTHYVNRSDNYSFQNTTLEEQDLYKLIVKLPDKQRIVFNLAAIEGYSHKEISIALSITESYSRAILTRARETLKKAIQSYQTVKS